MGRRNSWLPGGRVSRSNPVGHRADKYREVGLSSGNEALTRWAFVGTNPTDELITSGLPLKSVQDRCQARRSPPPSRHHRINRRGSRPEAPISPHRLKRGFRVAGATFSKMRGSADPRAGSLAKWNI